MTDDKKTGADEVRSEEELESFQRGHDGMQPEAPLATGPSYNLMLDDQCLGNFRLESCVADGVSKAPKEMKVKADAKDGDAVLTGIFTPTFGGDDILRGAVGNRSGADYKLEPLDKSGSALSGHFRVNRMDHCGSQMGDRAYIAVLETTEKAKKTKEDA